MGERVSETEFSREDRARYREKLKRCLDALRQMLDDRRFETERKLMGLEMEFYLVGEDGRPTMMNEKVLAHLESEDFQTELAQFNIEFNLAPHKLVGKVFSELEDELRTSLNWALHKAQELDAHIVMIGILPTLRDFDVTIQNVSNNPRYMLLNDQILAARGEDLAIEIEGVDRLSTRMPSIMMEAATTSTQLHLQVSPDGFASVWNAAQAIAGIQVALGANSPFGLGKQLHAESRIAIFEQSTDTRTEELVAQGVRPRVWFGERWIESVLDLFEENVRYYPALLPICEGEDPFRVLKAGDIPHLHELRLHNGTIYRWNRPVYDVARGRPRLRVENRVLPAGPTVADTIANAAFYYGLVRALADGDQPLTRQLSFAAACENFQAGARDGITAQVYWPGMGTVPVTELVLRRLLPLAHEGLDAWDVDPGDRDHFLRIIEERCLAHRNGATWQTEVFRKLYEDRGMDRDDALLELTRRYAEHMHTNAPVHSWPV